MKRTITRMSIALLTLLLSYSPQAVCQQDTSRVRHAKTDDADSEDDTPQAVHAKKKTASHMEAPVAFGIDGGLNGAALVFGGNTSTVKNGIRLGGIMDVHLVGVLHLELGLFYAMNGASDVVYQNIYSGQIVSGDYNWNVNTIEVPVNLQFKFGKPGRGHFFFGVGGYAGYNVSGTIRPNDVNNGVLKIGSGADDDLKALDIGIALNIGYELKDGLFFRFRSEGGLSDLQPKSEEAGTYVSTIRTSTYGLEVGYLFGNKPQQKHHQHRDDEYIGPSM